ncbi:MAG: hypothetical protein E7015_04245, partial [Alphaproteobacteria bacterium]|nr:hypothetical protein [Alphaproteobacteria bacterium]
MKSIIVFILCLFLFETDAMLLPNSPKIGAQNLKLGPNIATMVVPASSPRSFTSTWQSFKNFCCGAPRAKWWVDPSQNMIPPTVVSEESWKAKFNRMLFGNKNLTDRTISLNLDQTFCCDNCKHRDFVQKNFWLWTYGIPHPKKLKNFLENIIKRYSFEKSLRQEFYRALKICKNSEYTIPGDCKHCFDRKFAASLLEINSCPSCWKGEWWWYHKERVDNAIYIGAVLIIGGGYAYMLWEWSKMYNKPLAKVERFVVFMKDKVLRFHQKQLSKSQIINSCNDIKSK